MAAFEFTHFWIWSHQDSSLRGCILLSGLRQSPMIRFSFFLSDGCEKSARLFCYKEIQMFYSESDLKAPKSSQMKASRSSLGLLLVTDGLLHIIATLMMHCDITTGKLCVVCVCMYVSAYKQMCRSFLQWSGYIMCHPRDVDMWFTHFT